jgi:hypothetical protein
MKNELGGRKKRLQMVTNPSKDFLYRTHLSPEDSFGANDEDWAVYRKIVCDTTQLEKSDDLNLLECSSAIF